MWEKKNEIVRVAYIVKMKINEVKSIECLFCWLIDIRSKRHHACAFSIAMICKINFWSMQIEIIKTVGIEKNIRARLVEKMPLFS